MAKATVSMDLLTFTRQFTGSVTKCPLEAQAAEIDTRLEALYQYCQAKKVPMSKAHIRVTLGIDESTYQRWIALTTQAKNQAHITDDDRVKLEARSAALKKWQEIAESALLESMGTKQGKPTAEIFLAKSTFGYIEGGREAAQDVAAGIEQFLMGVGRIRKASQSVAPPPDDILIGKQSTD